MNEEWKYIEGYEGIYQVSNKGRVKVLPHLVSRGFCTCTCPEKILTPRKKDNGYLFVALYKGSKKKSETEIYSQACCICFYRKSSQ